VQDIQQSTTKNNLYLVGVNTKQQPILTSHGEKEHKFDDLTSMGPIFISLMTAI